MSPFNTVLICRPNVRLGNTLMLTPLLREIKQRLPHAHVDILTACQDAPDIFSGYDNVRSLIRLPRHGARHPLQFLQQLRRIRKAYDLVLDTCPKSGSARLYSKLAVTRNRFGFVSDQKLADPAVQGVPFPEAPRHMAQYPVFLFRRAMQYAGLCDYPRMNLLLQPAELSWAYRKLVHLLPFSEPGAPIVGVFTQATGNKQLPAEFWQLLAKKLQATQTNLRILEILAPGASPTLSGLAHYTCYASSDIRELAALINATNAFVCADGGIMHLAACTSAPVIGLFTYTDPETYKPFNHPYSGALTIDKPDTDIVAARLCAIIKGSGMTDTAHRQLPVGNVLAHAG